MALESVEAYKIEVGDSLILVLDDGVNTMSVQVLESSTTGGVTSLRLSSGMLIDRHMSQFLLIDRS
jgi:uncharacterized phosphosugar-binding protein